MEKRKHIWAMLILLATCLFSTNAFAYDAEIDGIYYNFNGDEAEVTYKNTSYNSYTGDIAIPESVVYNAKTYSVTSIGWHAFYKCSALTSVIIPNSVTSIESHAFLKCSRLTSITIGNSVTSIGERAFYMCSALTSVIIPNSVTSIGEDAFLNCSGLKKVIVPDIAAWCGITFADSDANPVGCAKHLYSDETTEIKNLVIPNSVKSIRSYAFYGCSGLTSVTIPNSVKSIGYGAFAYCSGLTSVNIPNSVTSIGEAVFYGCSALTSVTIPNSVTSIEYSAFAYCSGLTSVTLNSNAIASKKYTSSSSLGDIFGQQVKTYILGGDVTSIGDYAFYNCSGLTSVTIPNSVTSIGNAAFYNCSALTSVTIPNSVTSIGKAAFYGCSALTSVTLNSNALVSKNYSSDSTLGNVFGQQVKTYILGDEVTSIGDNAFRDCSELTSVTIPNSVTSIGIHAFSKCSRLTSVTIPNSVTSIGENAFYNCSGLKKVIVPDIAAWFGIAFGDVDANPLYYAKHLYSDETTEITNLIIPNSVTSIGDYAFRNCSGLTSVTIPNSVTSIGSSAFRDCSRLTSVTLNSNAIASKKYISSSSLRNVFGKQVNTYVIGEDVTNIGEYAFYNCSALTSVTIPNSIKSIGERTFYNCSALTSVTIPNSVTSIGQEAFYGCSGLASVTIGPGVLSIGTNAFTSSPKKVIWLTNTPPNGYANLQGSINYVANNLYTSLINVTVYPYLSSLFEVEGVKYVPVSPSERTCDAIDCAYNKSVEHIYIGKTVTNRGITLTVRKINPYICYGNTFIKDTKLHFKGIIAQQAFYGCSAMQTAELGQEITSIGMGAFGACKKLKGIEIPDAVESFGNNTFENCSSMTFVKMGNGVNTIPKYSFSGCSSLPTIQIPQNVTNIGDYVFDGCTSLETVLMDDGETELTLGSNGSNSLFASCPLDSVYIGRNINYSIASDKGYSPFYRNTKLRSVVITDKESEVTANEFSGCTALQTIQLGSKISSIGERAFHTCSKLEGIVIPDAVDTLGNNTFENCSSMTFVKMSNRVKTIPKYSFSGCSSLPTIQIPQNVTNIGDYVFDGCKSLETVLMDDGETELTLGSNGSNPLFASCPLDSVYIGRNINYSIASSKGYSPFYRNTKLRSVVITDKESEVTANEFSGCTALQTIQLGSKISSIGERAFHTCSKLEGIVIPDAVDTLGNNTFENCSSMTFVKMSNRVKTIPKYSFSGCSSLPTIQIPQNVTNIGDYVFDGCTSLETVLMDDGETELTLGSNGSSPLFASCPLDSVYIGRNINYSIASDKGYSPFYRNTKLRSVTITDKETEISPNEFYGCTALKNVRIGDGVTTFGNWAFSGCSSLDFFAFGSSVETIGKEAFSDCSALTKLISRAAIPPVCGTQALDDINKWECTLLVPDGSLTLYQTADQWKEFFFTEIDPDGIKGVEAEPSPTSEAEYFDLQGRRIDKAQKGINIIRNADGTTKKVLIKH